jgi:hypothetical protein
LYKIRNQKARRFFQDLKKSEPHERIEANLSFGELTVLELHHGVFIKHAWIQTKVFARVPPHL